MSRQQHEQDLQWMRGAIDLSRLCPASSTAFSVGAIIVDVDGREISRGHSRENDPHVHAEELALLRASGDPRLAKSTLYSTLEPCSQRRARPRSCAELILEAGVPRVVIAWREPGIFVPDAQGIELLRASGVAVVELHELAEAAQAVNQHLHLA